MIWNPFPRFGAGMAFEYWASALLRVSGYRNAVAPVKDLGLKIWDQDPLGFLGAVVWKCRF